MPTSYNPDTVPTSALASWVRDRIVDSSSREVSAELGISRETLTRVAARLPVRRGSIAQLTQAMRDLDGSSESDR